MEHDRLTYICFIQIPNDEGVVYERKDGEGVSVNVVRWVMRRMEVGSSQT